MLNVAADLLTHAIPSLLNPLLMPTDFFFAAHATTSATTSLGCGCIRADDVCVIETCASAVVP